MSCAGIAVWHEIAHHLSLIVVQASIATAAAACEQLRIVAPNVLPYLIPAIGRRCAVELMTSIALRKSEIYVR